MYGDNRKYVTVRQFVEAMRKNGYEQGHGDYVTYRHQGNYSKEKGNIIQACAIGQAGLNLGVVARDLHSGYVDLGIKYARQPDIIQLNDYENKPLSEIADAVEKWAKENKIYTKTMVNARIDED